MEKSSVSIKKAVLAIVFLGMTTTAVQSAETKFAFVDVQKIFAEANAAKATQTNLTQKQAQYKKEIEAIAANLQKINEDLKQPEITDADKVEKAKDFKAKQDEYRKKLADYEKKLTDERNSVGAEILNAVRQASQDIAKEKGYTAVLTTNQSMYYDKELDVTAEVLTRVDAAVKR
jgi:outer membrane protein